MIRISIPSYHKVDGNGSDSYTAYQVEVFQSGRKHTLEKRYSEFEELHKQIKKLITTPEFPPKRVMKFSKNVIEQRQQALENYMQGILELETIPSSFFKFIEVNLRRTDSMESVNQTAAPTVTHQPTVGFTKDAFLQENYRSLLPDIVAVGVHHGLYSSHSDDLTCR